MVERPGFVARLDASGWLLLVARLVVGPTFVLMGLAKVRDPVAFLKLVREYGLVPDDMPWMLNGIAVGLPWLEVTCGVLLLAGIAVRGTSLALSGLLAVFTAAIALRALGIHESDGVPFCSIAFDCGCGGGVVAVCSKLPQNLGLLVLSLGALLSRSRRYCLLPLVVGRNR